MGGDADDADSLENNIDSGANLFSDPKSGRRLKSRLSKTLMFQSSSGFDKNCMLTIEEPIDETVEEDDLTQMSEKKIIYECDKELAKAID